MNSLTLPISLKAKPGESAGGYLLRTAEANGHVNVYQLLSGIGFKSHRLTLAATLMDRARYMSIAQQLSIVDEARKVVWDRAGRTRVSPVRISGMHVPVTMLQNDLECFCPQCLREEPYWRKQWMLRPFAACVKHECLLLNACSICSKPLDLARGRLTLCGFCGTPLQEMEGLSTSAEPIRSFSALLEKASEDIRKDAWSFWHAYEQFRGACNDPAQNFLRTCMTVEFMEGGSGVARAVASEILDRSSGLHPRIHLVPFLTASLSCEKWADEVLEALPPIEYPASEDDKQITLSKVEACKVLDISSVSLDTLIRARKLKWPIGGRRQQRISALEISAYSKYLRSDVASAPLLVPRPIERESHEWADIIATAGKLCVHPDVVRSLVSSRWLKGTSCLIGKSRKTVVAIEVLKDFDAEFVLVGALAKQWDVNPTNLKEKLQSIGIHPVGGPGVDGVLTSLFRREDVRSIERQVIIDIADYPTKTGRKPAYRRMCKGPKRFLSAGEVSSILQISEQRVATLIRKNILVKVPNSRPSRISRDSVTRLQRLLASPEWMRLDDAAERAGCTVTVFRNTWAKSGVAQVKDLGPWKIVRMREVLHILDLQSEYLTASEAGKSLGTHRSHVRNLERGGRIDSVAVGGKKALKLYKRDDVRCGHDDQLSISVEAATV